MTYKMAGIHFFHFHHLISDELNTMTNSTASRDTYTAIPTFYRSLFDNVSAYSSDL